MRNCVFGNGSLGVRKTRKSALSQCPVLYRYLGVIQRPRDNGRRDQELSLQRAQAAWAQAQGLFASSSLPMPLKRAWLAGRILPAAYATLATSITVSARATAPLEGFFDRAVRILVQSWQ